MIADNSAKRVATGRKFHGGFLVCHGRVTRASPYVRRYIHVLAMRNAEYFATRLRVSDGEAGEGRTRPASWLAVLR